MRRGFEIAAERAEQVVAHTRPVVAGRRYLGDLAKIYKIGGGDVGKRHPQFCALPGFTAPPLGHQRRECRIGSRQQIPGRQHVIDRLVRRGLVGPVIKGKPATALTV